MFTIWDGQDHYLVNRTGNNDVSSSNELRPPPQYSGNEISMEISSPILLFEAETLHVSRFKLASESIIPLDRRYSHIVPKHVVDTITPIGGKYSPLVSRVESSITGTVFAAPRSIEQDFRNDSFILVRLSRSSRNAVSSYPGDYWTSVNVLLIQWTGEYAERIVVGRINLDAWEEAAPTKQLVKLM